MKAVLVTGATTPLGRAIAHAILDTGLAEHVVAVGAETRSDGGYGISDKLTYLSVDLTRERRVRRALFGPMTALGVEAIVHTAQHRSAADEGSQVHRLNVEATRTLLWLAEQHPDISTLIFKSDHSVYSVNATRPTFIREDQPLDLSPTLQQWRRDRVEADLIAWGHAGLGKTKIVVLRMAELLGPDQGSQIYDYLQSRVCLRPIGYDPMINLISEADAARAVCLGLSCTHSGVYNVPGFDTLPLSELIRLAGRREIPVPGPLLGPLYQARARVRGTDFSYALNQGRFHFSGVLDGTRAKDELGYVPTTPVSWPIGRDGGAS